MEKKVTFAILCLLLGMGVHASHTNEPAAGKKSTTLKEEKRNFEAPCSEPDSSNHSRCPRSDRGKCLRRTFAEDTKIHNQLIEDLKNPEIADEEKEKIACYAAEGGNVHLLEQALKSGVTPDPHWAFFPRCNSKCVEAIGTRDPKAIDTPWYGTWGDRPLHAAIREGSLDKASTLIDLGADPVKGNGMNETPAHLLVDSGAHPNTLPEEESYDIKSKGSVAMDRALIEATAQLKRLQEKANEQRNQKNVFKKILRQEPKIMRIENDFGETPESIIRREEEVYCTQYPSDPIAQQRCANVQYAIKQLEEWAMIDKKNHAEVKKTLDGTKDQEEVKATSEAVSGNKEREEAIRKLISPRFPGEFVAQTGLVPCLAQKYPNDNDTLSPYDGRFSECMITSMDEYRKKVDAMTLEINQRRIAHAALGCHSWKAYLGKIKNHRK